MFDESGKNTRSMELDIYGQVRNMEENVAYCPFRYPGQYEDEEKGLYYNRFRYYDSEIGHYLSQDPLGMKGAMPNLYSYISDNNILIDPLGLDKHSTSSSLQVGGRSFGGRSQRTILPDDSPLKPIVERVKKDLQSKGLDKPFHGHCAEINAIQKAVDSGLKLEDLKGATMHTVISGTNRSKKACDCSAAVMDEIGICH